MDLNNTIRNLREEFGKQLDSALADEVRQRKLEEAELEALAEVLPEVKIPELSQADAKKALKLKEDLDEKVNKMAELTAQICQVADDYHKQAVELRGLFVNKKHNVDTGRHSGNRLIFILRTLAKILENNTANAIIGFGSLPNQENIQQKISNYNGL